MDAIKAEGLTKRYGDLVAVDHISFSVQEGEFFGLLGPNGAGKTTTVRMLNGIMEPDAGSVLIKGIDMVRRPLEAKTKIGCISEAGSVYQDLSARENLDLVGRFHGLSRKDRESRSEELLSLFGLADRGDDYVRTYSKGMRQRASVACALIHRPPLLLLDEPTEGLDVQSRRIIVDLVKKTNGEGSTIVLTTHNIEEANRLCQRVCIISKGRIAAIESPEKLRRAYESIQTVEVAFDRKVDLASFQIPRVARVQASGEKWHLSTDDPDEVIRHIVRLSGEEGLKITSLSTVGPSLEDVFVELTEGRV